MKPINKSFAQIADELRGHMPRWLDSPYLIVAATLAWLGVPGIYALTRKIGRQRAQR